MMDLVFPDAFFSGHDAKVSLSSQSFHVKTQDEEITVPVSHIIGILDVKREESDVQKGLAPNQRAILKLLFVEDIVQHQSSDQSPDLRFRDLTFSFSSSSQDAAPIIIPPLYLAQLPSHLLSLPSDRSPNIHVIISTYSGTQKAAAFSSKVLRPLLISLGIYAYNVHVTMTADSVSDLTRTRFLPAANNGIPQLIILLSGDGGISDMVDTLLSEGLDENATMPTVALIPMGTGNALFNSACRPRPGRQEGEIPESIKSEIDYHDIPDATSGLRTLLHGVPRRIPTLTSTFSPGSQFVSYPSPPKSGSTATDTNPLKSQSPFTSLDPTPILSPLPPQNTLHGCILASWCLHASLVSLSDAPRYRVQGISRFQSAASELLSPADGKGMHMYRGRVEIQREAGGSWSSLQSEAEHDPNPVQKYSYILATLVSHLEPTFLISPASIPSSGLASSSPSSQPASDSL